MRKVLFLMSVGVLGLVSCNEDAPGGGPGTTSRFEGFESCAIVAPPSEVELSSYYTRYTNCEGIPVIGNDEVPEDAFGVANETIEFLLAGLDNVRQKLIDRGEYYILVQPGGTPRDVPEFANAPGQVNSGIYWDQPRCAASNAAGLLCMTEGNPDGHANVFLHEMSHMISIGGFQKIDSQFGQELSAAYSNAVSNGLWDNTYAQTNKEEYFAVCMQVFYEVGYPFVTDVNGDGNWNSITTRAQLEQYDPTMYNLIASRFNLSLNVPGCIQGLDYEAWQDPNVDCGTTVTDIDGNTYNIIRAGNTCWMAENLSVIHYKDGSPIQNVTDATAWGSLTSGGWCAFDNDNANTTTFGRLYNFEAINNPTGICPDGWHVATQDEWQALTQYATTFGNGGGGALKSTSQLWQQPNEGATNETGFSALPAGKRNIDGTYEGTAHHTTFWSSEQDGVSNAWSYNMWSNGNFTLEQSHEKAQGKSCRCVKD